MSKNLQTDLDKIKSGMLSKYLQHGKDEHLPQPIAFEERPLGSYGQPMRNKSGDVTGFKTGFRTKVLRKPISHDDVKACYKKHRKQINKAVNYYKHNPKHRHILMKSNGYANRDDINTYLRDSDMINALHYKGKMSDHQYNLEKRWYVQDDLADGIQTNESIDMEHKKGTNASTVSMKTFKKEQKMYADAQRTVGMKNVPKNHPSKISWNNPDADYVSHAGDKLDDIDTKINNYLDDKKFNKVLDRKTKKPKIIQDIDDYKQSAKEHAPKPNNMMSAFKSEHNHNVSNSNKYNHQNKHVQKHNRATLHTKSSVPKAKHRMKQNGLDIN